MIEGNADDVTEIEITQTHHKSAPPAPKKPSESWKSKTPENVPVAVFGALNPVKQALGQPKKHESDKRNDFSYLDIK